MAVGGEQVQVERPRGRSTWLLDAVVALLVAFISLPSIVTDTSAVSILLSILLVLPLFFRNHYPQTVFIVVAAVALVQLLLDVKLGADAALLAALYTVAATAPVRRTAVAIAVMEVGALLAVLRWSPHNALVSFIFITGMVTAAAALGFYTRTRRAYLNQLQERANRLERERDHQIALASAAERARIARELHDIVAHHLTVMVTLSEGAAATATASPERAADAMRLVSETGRRALTDTRHLLGVLREGGAQSQSESREPLPDLNNLEKLIGGVRDAGLPAEYITAGMPRELPDALQLTLYRLVQEALTNTLKHAGPAAQSTVSVRYLPTGVMLEVVDNGVGQVESTEEEQTGHGISGMRERVNAWGGSLDVGPATPQGWRVSAFFGTESLRGTQPQQVSS